MYRTTFSNEYCQSISAEGFRMETDQLVFLQDSVGTGRPFAVKKLVKTLQSHSEKYLIYGTTGIGALSYPGRTILHSQSRLGIDKQLAGSS
jgi:hypothetical protein